MFTINITTYVYPFTYNNLFLLQIQHILHPMKRECFLEPSLWWNLKCHNFSLCQNMSFTCDMIFFCYEKIFNVTILICVMTQVSHVTWNVCTHWSEGFLGDLHYDESVNVTSLICVMTWISHMTWIFFSFVVTRPNITVLVCVMTQISFVTWVFCTHGSDDFFGGPSLWWKVKCHHFNLCHDMSFTRDMKFLFFFRDKTLNIIVLVSVTTQVSHVTWDFFNPLKRGFFRGFHCDETLSVIFLTCTMWHEFHVHVTWNFVFLHDQTLNVIILVLCHNTSFTFDTIFLNLISQLIMNIDQYFNLKWNWIIFYRFWFQKPKVENTHYS